MKISNRPDQAGFTLVEIMFSMTIVVLTIGMALGVFVFSLRTMYKDTQRLASNASLRSFMSQISNKTLNASFYYVFPYYTALDGDVDLVADPAPLTEAYNNANDLYDQWIAHGDCLVLVTHTSEFRTTDIKQIRIYYRVTTNQTDMNGEAALRYYETADTAGSGLGWGEGTSTTSNGHPLSGLVSELNNIDLKTSPIFAGSKLINARCLGRNMPTPPNRYPIFSTLAPSASPSAGSISINVEFVTGVSAISMLSSSSFNYTISPRK